jgi:hypothetical protein
VKKSTLNNLFEGLNNADLERARGRLMRGNSYRDLSTVCIIPTRGCSLQRSNHSGAGFADESKFYRVFIEQMKSVKHTMPE